MSPLGTCVASGEVGSPQWVSLAGGRPGSEEQGPKKLLIPPGMLPAQGKLVPLGKLPGTVGVPSKLLSPQSW